MKKRLWFLVLVTGSMMLVALLAGCDQDKSAPELVIGPDALTPPAEALSASTESAPATSAQAVAKVEFTDQACLVCHTNQDVLKALAIEEEAGESLSSGPG